MLLTPDPVDGVVEELSAASGVAGLDGAKGAERPLPGLGGGGREGQSLQLRTRRGGGTASGAGPLVLENHDARELFSSVR